MNTLIGVYRIIPTPSSIIAAAKYHGFYWLNDNRGDYSYCMDMGIFENLSLVEIQIFGDYSPDLLMNIEQDDQAPYLEFFLDPSGNHLINEEDAIQIDGRRVCFFIHFLDASKPLKIGDQQLNINAVSSLPERLYLYTHYVPVD